jgi:3-phenylpropionate/trans-cinnamate dioxygenase ferredoxin subunit
MFDPMSEPVKVARLVDLAPGGKKLVEVEGRAIALFNVDGHVYAIDDICTHDGGPLGEGELVGAEISCPRHGARFDVRTGRPLCMPAIEPVTTHQVELRGDDIYVTVNEND